MGTSLCREYPGFFIRASKTSAGRSSKLWALALPIEAVTSVANTAAAELLRAMTQEPFQPTLDELFASFGIDCRISADGASRPVNNLNWYAA